MIILFGVCKPTYGQTQPKGVFSDPDEMRLADPRSLRHVLQHALSQAQQADLCRRGRGFIGLTCQVDSSGRIERIIAVKLHQAAQTVPPSVLQKLTEQIQRRIVFHVPIQDKFAQMSKFRRPSVMIPLQMFCQ
ncbi:hypothetical protein F1C16_03060 [Hymenobacter sp. NBH84]|nr:hypothetical protein F1C16_03060 [Hymenobacter sp. NBH84]